MAEIDTGPTEIGTGGSPSPSQNQEALNLSQIAWTEDATAYIQERTDQRREAQGEEVDDEARARRIQDALRRAREETAEARKTNGLGEQQPDLDQQYQSAEAQWQADQQAEQNYEIERELARAEGKFQAVAENLKSANPQVWGEITDAMGTIDATFNEAQVDAFKHALLRGDSRESMAIAHRLSQPSYDASGNMTMTPAQKIEHLASLPPEQISEVVNQARYWLQIEHDVSNRYRAAYAAQGKRHTSAPPVFKAPRGGASPPKDIGALAQKENPKDYIRARQAQMKRERE